MKLIGLTGFAQSGKDAAASFLVERGWKRLAFADAVRASALAIDLWIFVFDAEVNDDDFYSLKKAIKIRDIHDEGFWILLSVLVDRIGWDAAKRISEVRRLLQRIGTEGGREIHGSDCWVRIVGEKIYNIDWNFEPGLRYSYPRIVITDVRFPEEVDLIRAYEGQIIRITKPGVGPVNSHKSDAAIDDIAPDLVLENDGTLDDLKAKILALAGEEVTV